MQRSVAATNDQEDPLSQAEGADLVHYRWSPAILPAHLATLQSAVTLLGPLYKVSCEAGTEGRRQRSGACSSWKRNSPIPTTPPGWNAQAASHEWWPGSPRLHDQIPKKDDPKLTRACEMVQLSLEERVVALAYGGWYAMTMDAQCPPRGAG